MNDVLHHGTAVTVALLPAASVAVTRSSKTGAAIACSTPPALYSDQPPSRSIWRVASSAGFQPLYVEPSVPNWN